MEFVNTISTILGIFVAVAYSYQVIFFLVGMFFDAKKRVIAMQNKKEGIGESASAFSSCEKHRFAFVVAARNEENVISRLIQSIKQQNYPSELMDIFVIADNCTDDTAAVAKEAGACVYKRFNKEQIGKGYALSYFFAQLKAERGSFKDYDAYLIFDADNILDTNYIRAIDAKFSKGHRVIMGYRNSKNFDTNWVTAGHSVAFIREAQYLNRPRMIFHSSATVSGTGYMISNEILEENNGWPYYLLTEDVAFSADLIIKGEKITYAENAVFYDEQPLTFKQSWNQRLRWARGFYQVIFKYGKGLLSGMFKDKSMFLSRYDMFMFLAPSMFFNIATVALSLVAVILNIINFEKASEMTPFVMQAILSGAVGYYLVNFAQAFVVTIAEWKRIKARSSKKIVYMFTYPIYMFTYIPISFVAIFTNVKWKPIPHTVSKSLDELEKNLSSYVPYPEPAMAKCVASEEATD